MKKPKKPSKPNEPLKPQKPETHFVYHPSVDLDGYSTVAAAIDSLCNRSRHWEEHIREALKDLTPESIKLEDLALEHQEDWDYGDYCRGTIRMSYKPGVKIPLSQVEVDKQDKAYKKKLANYRRKCKIYNKNSAKYKIDLEQYEKDLAEYNRQKRKEQFEKLKKEFDD